MRITKIKLTKDDKIHVAYEKAAERGWDEYTFTCSEKPRPELYGVLKDLDVHVADICELPADYSERITVKGVTFSYGGEAEVMGATITAQMELESSNCPLNLNTPHKASESYSEAPADEKQLLSDDCIIALDDLVDEIERYIQGDRAQQTLFAVK